MNREAHIILGEVAGIGGSLVWSYFKKEEIKGWDWLAILAGSAIGGVLPDGIDPPLHPNHRALGHSIAGNGGLAFGLLKLSNNPDINSTLKWFLRSFVFAQCSHLISDSTTPKGIPII